MQAGPTSGPNGLPTGPPTPFGRTHGGGPEITEPLPGGVILRAPNGGDVSGKEYRRATVTRPLTVSLPPQEGTLNE